MSQVEQSRVLLERRSIEYIPENERRGKVSSQFTLWLAANLQITAVMTGALTVVWGGDALWSMAGLLLGQAIGAAIMALHGAQGPKLGLPQMLASRAQFGALGAVLPLILACAMYLGFNATGMLLSGQALGQLLGVHDAWGVAVFAIAVIAAAALGYHAIHRLGKLASALGLAAFAYLFFRLLGHEALPQLMAAHHVFQPGAFFTTVSLAASWQIAFAPYVSDYSRYLPRATSSTKVALAIGLGSAIGAQLSMSLGVLVAAIGGAAFRGHEVAYFVGLGASGIIASALFFCVAFGKITISALNAYGGFMCLSAIADACGGIRLRRGVTVLALALVSAGVAVAAQHGFLALFKSFLLVLLAFFTPWSAVNLVDFYLLSDGKVDPQALSDPKGRYAGWNKAGLAAYASGLLIQIPFVDCAFYTGPMVKWLGGVDISWLMGWLLPAVVYGLIGARARTDAAAPRAISIPQKGE